MVQNPVNMNAGTTWDPAAYAKHASFVPALGADVLALLDPRPGEHILDLGCGDGVLTEEIVAAGAVVVGVDASAPMVRAAQRRGLDARVMNGHALPFHAEFDAVFTNAALHWMLRRAAVASGVFAALRPGGRFVGEMGGSGNVAALRQALTDAVVEMGYALPEDVPQWYPTEQEFGLVYGAVGFVGIEARLIARPTPLPSGAHAWFRTFRAGFLDTVGVPEKRRDELADRAAAKAEAILPRDADGHVLADYIRLRFSMRKP